MLNKAILQGRFVADPELRRTQSGTAVSAARIASDRDFKSKDPNAQNVDFINVVFWGKTAEFVNRYFTKGSMILIEGRIQTRDYTDNNGQRRFVNEVVAESVNFCGSKGNNGGNAGNDGYNTYAENPTRSSSYNASAPQQAPANDFAELNDDDGELPF